MIHALDYTNQIKLFGWIGPVNNAEKPNNVHGKIISESSDISQHFNNQEFSADSLQVLLLNQTRGTPIGNLSLSKTCRSEIDSGIQCSVEGSDLFHSRVLLYPICNKYSRLNISFNSLELDMMQCNFQKHILQT